MVDDSADSLDIFDYLDYRAFLRDYYVERKTRRGLSFRGFSRRAGLGSPNYFKLVMDGERNLTDEMAERFAKALLLSDDAARYFQDLVRFTQAKTSQERSQFYTRLIRFQRYREVRPLALAQAAYYSHWYVPAIRELVASRGFEEDPSWIAERLWPKVTTEEAENALAILQQLGLLVRDEQGKLRQRDAAVSTGAEVDGMHVAGYHRAMMQRAADAIDDIPAESRDISSLTLCLGADGLARIKKRIQAFRRELLELSTTETELRQVVQLNFQLFPLSRNDS